MSKRPAPVQHEEARCRYCEFEDRSSLAAALAEKHADISGHDVDVKKIAQYVIRGDDR